MPPLPERKLFFAEPLQDEELPRQVTSTNKNHELEINESSQVTEILAKCCKFDNHVNLLCEAYQLVYGVSTNLLDFSNLTKIETPTENTVLHIAAWNGNNDIVNLVIQHAPKLLFKFNKNNDSALHVAARGGHISTVKTLLTRYANIERNDIKMAWLEYTNKLDDPEEYNEKSNMEDLLKFVTEKNGQGNTMLHEAMLRDKSNISRDMIFKVCELYKTEDLYGSSLANSCYEFVLDIVNNAKKSILYLAVENGDKDAVKLVLNKFSYKDVMPKGLSPIVAAIMKQNQEILSIILEIKPTWIHLRNEDGRLPLHYAASVGYLEGVELLLDKCKCCTIQRDKYGYFPIHLASYGGHVEVVNKLLEYCPDPTEMIDAVFEQNILHIAANYGKHNVIRNILESEVHERRQMINQKDRNGDTPLHLAARSCHPMTVFYLVNQNNKKVDLDRVNQNNETALDIVKSLYPHDKSSSLRQHLTWTALKSAGAKLSTRRAAIQIDNDEASKPSVILPIEHNDEEFKKIETNKRKSIVFHPQSIENLTIVSTLIITASVAACLAVPGEAQGKANNLYHAMFHAFIIFITISLFSSISSIILLFWATLGITELVTFSLQIVMPLLGISLISLSLAFMAGLYTVISELTWLANLFLVMTVIFVVVVSLLYTFLFLPSTSTRKSMRYISYYPLLVLASLAEGKLDHWS